VRNAELGTPGQRGCAGSGIFDNATSNLIVAHNLIGKCDNAGIYTIVRPDRRRPVAEGSQVTGNIFMKCKVGIVFLSRNNEADANAYFNMAGAFQGLLDNPALAGDSDAWRHVRYGDLASWRAAYGWDRSSVTGTMELDFNPDTLQLTVSAPGPLPTANVFSWIETDMLAKTTGRTRLAGPLADLREKRIWNMDPRLPS